VSHVLVPVKRLDAAKSRLAEVLTASEREELMLRLLQGVVAAVREAGVERITLVTSERLVLPGVESWDDRGLAWNDALAAAMAEVVRSEVATIVSADLPELRADEVQALIDATPARGLAVARALDGGTNAVSMRPPGLVRTRFGEAGSAAVHAALGVPAVMVDLPGLAFDVDTPTDLERLKAAAA
jgi:2-phospho-L-lactate guanylyltransferase